MGQGAEITIELSEVEKRRKVDVKNEEGKKEKLLLYLDGETVAGSVSINLKGRKLEHHGIRVEFVGQIGEWRYYGSYDNEPSPHLVVLRSQSLPL